MLRKVVEDGKTFIVGHEDCGDTVINHYLTKEFETGSWVVKQQTLYKTSRGLQSHPGWHENWYKD